MQDSLLIRLSLSSCPPPDLSHVVCVAVSQTFGGNALLFYWIMLGNSALAGTWMLHLAKFLWETVFERLIFHNQAEPARVSSMHQPPHTKPMLATRSPRLRHTLPWSASTGKLSAGADSLLAQQPQAVCSGLLVSFVGMQIDGFCSQPGHCGFEQ